VTDGVPCADPCAAEFEKVAASDKDDEVDVVKEIDAELIISD
jgi:hypothetical protein